MTFWLSARSRRRHRPRRNRSQHRPHRFEEPIVFSTTEQLDIVPCSLNRPRRHGVRAASPIEHTNEPGGPEFACFSALPTPGDALLIGLSNAVPSGAVLLRFDCRVSGVGVDPDDPPYIWEAWTGGRLGRNAISNATRPGRSTGPVTSSCTCPGACFGFAAAGGHTPQGWLRCRLVAPAPSQPTYREPPMITSVDACTIGGTARIVHARVVRDESLGVSDGTPGTTLPP